MKQLKFSDPLPGMILEGKKDSTWRLNDDKEIIEGDELSLCNNDGKEFAQARAVFVKETTFGELAEEDWKGHEKYENEEEMYRTYSGYYNMDVTPSTKVKIIRFALAGK